MIKNVPSGAVKYTLGGNEDQCFLRGVGYLARKGEGEKDTEHLVICKPPLISTRLMENLLLVYLYWERFDVHKISKTPYSEPRVAHALLLDLACIGVGIL